MALLVGQFLGNYYICEHLGQGGYADVYRCEHQYLKTERAIKVAQKSLINRENERLFLNEVELHAQMHHPSIVNVYDSGEIQNYLYLVMDYVPLGTLSMLAGQQIELSIIVPYVKAMADALDYIHQKQVVHCDVKPDNFLLNTNNTLLLSDFGIAVKTTQPVSTVYGTLEYVSPEQLQRRPCPASDQYSLAITVYEWLTGECPFDNQKDILQQSPPSLRLTLPTLAQGVEDVVCRGLAKQPQDRYPTVSAFAAALESAFQQSLRSSVPAQPASPVSPISPASSPIAVLKQTRKLGQPIAVSPSLTTLTRRLQPSGTGARSLYVYQGHMTEVSVLAWSPDGTQVASADINNTIHIWNAFDGSDVSIHQGFSHMILNLLWSPDQACIAVADEIQVVQFWDLKAGKKLFRYQHRVGKPSEVGIGLYYPMAWSHDGQFMISASDDQPLEKWDTTTGKRLLAYTGYSGTVKALAWSPDERLVASGGSDAMVHIWDAANGDRQFVYRGHRGQIRSLDWSPSSKRVVSAGMDGLAHIWNAADGSNLLIYNAHRPRSIYSLAWSPDGTKIASAGDDKKVRIWNALTGQTLIVYGEHTATINAVAWSPDGEHLASASDDGTVRTWHVDV